MGRLGMGEFEDCEKQLMFLNVQFVNLDFQKVYVISLYVVNVICIVWNLYCSMFRLDLVSQG